LHSDFYMLRWLADSDEPTSFANKLRARRFHKFEALAAQLPRPLRILDVGGTNAFWENRGWQQRADVQILTLNLVAEEQQHANIKPLAGDATDLAEFGDRSIDIVFSNSVIEHLFTFESQRRMASEIQRVGKAFWVQTPNFWFPVEPHFHFVGWQWLPVAVRTSILQRRTCGWRGPCPDPVGARRLVEEVRLLTRRELRELFPRATIMAERFGGFVKSWTALGGFD
jgi:Methyltransferase domain